MTIDAPNLDEVRSALSDDATTLTAGTIERYSLAIEAAQDHIDALTAERDRLRGVLRAGIRDIESLEYRKALHTLSRGLDPEPDPPTPDSDAD